MAVGKEKANILKDSKSQTDAGAALELRFFTGQ